MAPASTGTSKTLGSPLSRVAAALRSELTPPSSFHCIPPVVCFCRQEINAIKEDISKHRLDQIPTQVGPKPAPRQRCSGLMRTGPMRTGAR